MNRLDGIIYFSVENANPNGDPLDANRPRQISDGRGEVSDVCLKHKIRTRLDQLGETILVKDSFKCEADGEPNNVSDRYKDAVGSLNTDDPEIIKKGLEKFIDVRLFGQVYAFKGNKKAAHTTGAVSISSAFSLEPIDITSKQIAKCISLEPGDKKGSDTLGMKHSVDYAIYKCFISVSGAQADKNGVSDNDIELLQKAIETLFVGDETAARPAGSMNILKIIWISHTSACGNYNYAKIKDSVIEHQEGKKLIVEYNQLPDVKYDIVDDPWL